VEPIGLIGLGLMGSALADRFHARGIRVIGFDVRDEARSQLSALGGVPASSVAEVFASARTVVFSLPSSNAVADVLRAAGESLSGATIIDTTTGDPIACERIGRQLSEGGSHYLDATLTGSSAEARAGKVVVTAGAEPAVFTAVEPILQQFARRSYHVGPWGSGARVKLAINLILGLNRAVLAEGLAFARQIGLNPASFLEILRESSAYSRVMDTKGGKMITGDFEPEARLSQHLKDVKLILEAANRAGAVLPFCRLHDELLEGLVRRGLGDCDNSSIIRAFDPSGGAA